MGRNPRFLPPVLRKLYLSGVRKVQLLGVQKDILLGGSKGKLSEAKTGIEQNDIGEVLNKRKVPENLQTAVSSEYQRLSKWPHNSRI
jgi:hypothetical protein